MRRFLVPLLVFALPSCNTVGFNAVLIRPIYGFVDGCNAVKVSGTGFGDDTTVTFDMQGATAEVTGLVLAKDDTSEDERRRDLNEGFYVLGVSPPAPTGASGYADVVVNAGGKADTIAEAFYYVACPTPGYFESAVPSSELAAGASVLLTGCSFDAAAMQVVLYNDTVDGTGEAQATVPLTSACGTAQVSFTAPALPDGAYVIAITDPSGAVLFGGECPAPDTADTGYYCAESAIVYGVTTTTGGGS